MDGERGRMGERVREVSGGRVGVRERDRDMVVGSGVTALEVVGVGLLFWW